MENPSPCPPATPKPTRRIARLGWPVAMTAAVSLAVAGGAHGQQTAAPVQLPQVDVNAPPALGYAAQPNFNVDNAQFGPLGSKPILDTPTSVTVVPESLMVNQMPQTVNDTLRYLPSVQVRDQQGFEVSRPQSRGFMGSIVQNTRLDGLNIIGTTAIPAENLSGIQVLNGMAGSLFGPETPAGVFNYILKRPTDTPIYRFIEGYDSNGIFTEQADLGGRVGPNGEVGYRLNVVHGEGQDYTSDSSLDRTLLSGQFDFHIDDRTVIELDGSHYSTNATGLPGSIVYDSGKSTILPKAPNPTTLGLGQPDAGPELITNTGLMKIKHSFNDDWNIEFGGLYQDAIRNLFGITNTFTNNVGAFTVTKNFTAVPHFTIGSNEAALNGHVTVFGFVNDLTLGTNGFVNGQYSYRDSIAQVLGTSSLTKLVIFSSPAVPYNGGQYESGKLYEQSIITADTFHFNEKVAVQGVLNTSFIGSRSYSVPRAVTSADSRAGVLSPTVSLTYKPVKPLTLYATMADSVEQGDQAPAGTKNVNQVLTPYSDHMYEVGAKYAVQKDLLLTLDAFRMTRPLAQTNAITNVFAVVGTQRNYGTEFFVQGNINPDLSVFGGVTYVDAELLNTGIASTSYKKVVGVPDFKGDFVVDYHPVKFPIEGMALTGALHFEGKRAATDTNNSYAPAYATVDLGIRYNMPYLNHHATARFEVVNVTDTHYYSSIADGNIVGSPGANTAYLGDPRTIRATLEVDF